MTNFPITSLVPIGKDDMDIILASRKKKRDYVMPFQLPATDATDACSNVRGEKPLAKEREVEEEEGEEEGKEDVQVEMEVEGKEVEEVVGGKEQEKEAEVEEGEGPHSAEVMRFLGKSYESIPAIFRDVLSSPFPRHTPSREPTDPTVIPADVIQTLVSQSMCILDALLIPAMMEGEKK
jgi:hypothetical protein